MTSFGVRSSALLEPERTMTVVHLPEPAAAPGFGVHLTLDGYGGCQHLLGDGKHVLACLNELPERLGMHKIAEPSLVEMGDLSPKDPGGVSGFVMIAESHISIHTFPLAASSAPMSAPARTVWTRSRSANTSQTRSRCRISRSTWCIAAPAIRSATSTSRRKRWLDHSIAEGRALMETNRQKKAELLHRTVKHIDITAHDPRALIDAYKEMSFIARELGRACELYERMLQDRDCTIILTIAGSTSAAGCMQAYVDLVRHNMVDVVVATGATIVDMDFFEALGFRHYSGSQSVDDAQLRDLYIDRIYDTFIDEEELQHCDRTIKEIADALEPRPYSSREFIGEMGAGWSPTRRARSSRTRSSRSPMSAACRCSARRSPTAARGSGWSPTRSAGRMRTSASTRCATFAS